MDRASPFVVLPDGSDLVEVPTIAADGYSSANAKS